MIACIVYLKRSGFDFDFRLRSFKFHLNRFRTLLKIGIPVSIQNVITNFFISGPDDHCKWNGGRRFGGSGDRRQIQWLCDIACNRSGFVSFCHGGAEYGGRYGGQG